MLDADYVVEVPRVNLITGNCHMFSYVDGWRAGHVEKCAEVEVGDAYDLRLVYGRVMAHDQEIKQ